ncbi:MAG: type I DNA topoisomerase, partial [Alphaproteobacteria bacterium]|nr:type I DNA topoisomerase [Alphaproteobacteria bacterium]
MSKNLVIVESPAKAKTINKYLGSDYAVLASYGHVRDLVNKDGSVLPDDDFAMKWQMDAKSDKNVNEIKKALKKADALYLAPDPDREGEAIAWHIYELLNDDGLLDGKDVHRVTFNEVTKTAVQNAFKQARELDQPLIDAYLARRTLDYLVGFNISPVLWRKLPGSRSAGRVQSVALRLICERENEIEAFKPQEYWSIESTLRTVDGASFTARLTHLAGNKLDKFDIGNEEDAKAAAARIDDKNLSIQKIEKKQVRRNPSPPFITSTLQMDASRKLGLSASRTMRIAQKLYEGIEIGDEGSVGLITYMRTDSVRVAEEAQEEARAFIRGEFGKEYLPAKPPVYKSKKSAQEAHEAIRPTSLLRPPDAIKSGLPRDQYNLYKLIWNRFVASQMHNAELEQTSIDIEADKYIFRTTGSVIQFPGFMKLYIESGDNGSDEEGLLPSLSEGDVLKTIGITPKQHFTQPLPRFTEATLVKELEAKGIGRPSTYAAILSTIQDRKYAEKNEGKFEPTELGEVVSDLLVERFSELMDYNFTANMENNLDKIEEGGLKWVNIVMEFYRPFNKNLADAMENLGKVKPKDIPTDQVCDKCDKPMVIKWGRHGRF